MSAKKYNRKLPVKGEVVGRFTLTGGYDIIKYKTHVEIICFCGKIFTTRWRAITSGHTKSCGCETVKLKSAHLTKHGLCATECKTVHPIYSAWHAARKRCYNKNYNGSKNYLGRGITVCKEWLEDFNVFYKWAVDNGWRLGLSLDIIDVNGNYEPSNCRWLTNKEQQRNKTTNVRLFAFGESKIMADWERDSRCNVSTHTIRDRLRKGWSAEDALTKIIRA